MLSTLIKATKNHLKMSFGSFVLLPNITGKLGIVSGSIYGASGAFSRNSDRYSRISASVVANAEAGINFSASNSNSIYGDSTTVQPKSLIFNYVIKY